MTFRFDPRGRLVLVRGTVRGPTGEVECRLAVDTGASMCQINHRTLRAVGFDVSQLASNHRMNTAGGPVDVGAVTVESLASLGQRRVRFRVLCHTLPTATGVDGLLGLDFFRGHVLTLDFHQGDIDLRPPRPRWQFWR